MTNRFPVALAVAAAVALAPAAASATYTITPDATGGDCGLVGAWDPATSTCTLTQDIVVLDGQSAIQLPGAGITLDGAGHAISNGGTGYIPGWAVGYYGYGNSNVTVRNLTISGFDRGMFFFYGAGNVTVENVTIRQVQRGIEFRDPVNAAVQGCRFENLYDAILFDGGSGYAVRDSVFASSSVGLIVRGDDGIVERNTFTGVGLPFEVIGWIGGDWNKYPAERNLLRDNTVVGGRSYVMLAESNVVVHNDFLGGATVEMSSYPGYPDFGNVFDQPLPVGGNYWEGAACQDLDANGICDAPVAFSGGADNLPWTLSQGWVDADADGSPRAVDCNDGDASAHPGAAEIPYDGVDQNCNGMADDDDLDRDGYPAALDCNDALASVHPGAAEVVRDGIDQDCNGYDLTVVVSKAVWQRSSTQLSVEATSSRGAAAGLQVSGFGAMKWDATNGKWVLTVKAATYPATISVLGAEGSVAVPVVRK